jgi:hypothetical protein
MLKLLIHWHIFKSLIKNYIKKQNMKNIMNSLAFHFSPTQVASIWAAHSQTAAATAAAQHHSRSHATPRYRQLSA